MTGHTLKFRTFLDNVLFVIVNQNRVIFKWFLEFKIERKGVQELQNTRQR